MNKLNYLKSIKRDLEKQALQKHFHAGSAVEIDWGELEFILSFVSQIDELMSKTRFEEKKTNHLVIAEDDDSGKIKCLDCLILHLQNDRQVPEQLFAYAEFVRDNNLEEAFEYFWQRCLSKGELS
ncbi:hypothetical protein [Sporosarcina sp. FSL K6-1508]|uniref:hypothetical protein n=1 Tax=Sporosarcina sp. FSL K6-1508 TaxID=2921553 RepID=UPI0030FA602C